LEAIAAYDRFGRTLPVNEEDSGNHNQQSKRQQTHAKCGESFHGNRLPSQTALNFWQGRAAGGPDSACHAHFARKIAGRETSIHLSNTADNGACRYTLLGS